MSFKKLDIKNKYRSSDTSNIAEDFIEKVLLHSVKYKRAVGFFSSSSLIFTSRGLSKIAESYSGGKPAIQYIVSPKLTKEDVEAIKKGYQSRDKVIENSLLREFNEVDDEFAKERLNLISHLIESNAMDIQVAITEDENGIGMYHEKIGIFEDEDGNKIAFTGSLNESVNAYLNNFESIRVYKSWQDSNFDCQDIESDFDNLWLNATRNVTVIDFPKAVKDKIFEYRMETYDKNIDEREKNYKLSLCDNINPYIPKGKLYDYQQEAIRKWLFNKGRGIFDMATGTGKTFTGYGAIVSLLKMAKYKLATVIICPYQHLVEQWVEDMPLFNIFNPIIGYSNSKYADYLSQLNKSVQDYNDGILDYFFFICTNATYKLEKVQNVLQQIKHRALIVADEAHNLGTKNMKECLLDNFNYRLALSATVERYQDDNGTQQIFSYFGEKCIEYTMEKAITEDKLTKYYYYPIITTLDSGEIEEYLKITKQIKKCTFPDKNCGVQLTEMGKRLAIKRARIVAGAHDKIVKLKQEMLDHLTEKNMLVYCGTSKLENDNGEEIKQIDAVSRMLGYELNMQIGRYTSQESAEERISIKERFQTGNLQALIAIKCLDEGVNIPGIKTAFILASSTNPREYIQRRGRVLRKAPGKAYAVIYDFVTLPCEIEKTNNLNEYTLQDFRALAKNEYARITEFSRLALNPSDSLDLLDKINDKYQLSKFEITDEFEKIDWDDENYE